MLEERGQIAGDVKVSELMNLWGSVAGNVTVVKGGKLYVRGVIHGNLIVQDGGRAHLFGNVARDLVLEPGSKAILSGILGGNAVNKGGRLHIDACGRVLGKVKTKGDGKTTYERGAPEA